MSNYVAKPGPIPGTTLWQITADDEGDGTLRVIPDAVMDVVCFGGTLLFAGPDTTASLVPSSPSEVTYGMRLAPGVAHTLLGIPADELVNQRVELQQLTQLDRSVLEVAHLDPASALEQVMTSLWQNATPNPTELDLAHSLNQAAETGTSVSGTAKQHGLSERTLRRISHRLFGYGPKTLMAIHRFQHALRLARSGSSIGEAAAVARYADQAHLSREARRLGGAPIGALIRGD